MGKSSEQSRTGRAAAFEVGGRSAAVIIFGEWVQITAASWAGVEMQFMRGVELGLPEGMLAAQEAVGTQGSNSEDEGGWRRGAQQNSGFSLVGGPKWQKPGPKNWK